MPYSGPGDENLPSNVKKLSAERRKRWTSTWNSVYQRAKRKGMTDRAAEERAFKVANGNVK